MKKGFGGMSSDNALIAQVSLLDEFAGLAEPFKQVLAKQSSPLLMGLMVLAIAKERKVRDYLSAEHIVAALEAAGVATTKEKIRKAFSRAGTKISRKIIDEEVNYKIMTQGLNVVTPLLGAGSIEIFFVEAGKPRTARILLGEIIADLRGDVIICDPFYGVKSLDTIMTINAQCKIRFLTIKTSENIVQLNNALSDLKRERNSFEIRIYPKNDFHDRYILCGDYLLILGHGIKDIGNKESFVIKIDKTYAANLMETIKHGFEEKWQLSRII